MDPIQLRTHHYVDADGILVSNADWLDEEYTNRLRQEAIGRSETHGEWVAIGTVNEVGSPVELTGTLNVEVVGWVDEVQRINWQEIGTGVIVFGGRRTPARMWVGPGPEPEWLARQENPGYGLDDEPGINYPTTTAPVALSSIVEPLERASRRMGELAMAVRTSMNFEYFAALAALLSRLSAEGDAAAAAAEAEEDGPAWCRSCGETHPPPRRWLCPYRVNRGEVMPDGDQPSTGKGDPLAGVYGAFDRTMASIDEVLNEPS